ncbi:hypothetical protein pipiens_008240 [Culex pipiens pipiens]|uniref:Uncharacterized protein n=1 Tax=Culex pipiens pipiens TaxID=38569 RepID=A0ABD1DKB8_CULPP
MFSKVTSLVLVAIFSVALVSCNPTLQSEESITYGAEVNVQDVQRAAFANQQRYVVFNNKRSTFFEAWRACMSLGLRLAHESTVLRTMRLFWWPFVTPELTTRDRGSSLGRIWSREGSFVWLTANREVGGYGSGILSATKYSNHPIHYLLPTSTLII